MGDEAAAPLGAGPGGVVVVDAVVVPAGAGDVVALDLEYGDGGFGAVVGDVPGPAAAGGDPVVGAVGRAPGVGAVLIEHGAAFAAVVVERDVGEGVHQGAVGLVKGAVAVGEVIDGVVYVAGVSVGVDEVDAVGVVGHVARVGAGGA